MGQRVWTRAVFINIFYYYWILIGSYQNKGSGRPLLLYIINICIISFLGIIKGYLASDAKSQSPRQRHVEAKVAKENERSTVDIEGDHIRVTPWTRLSGWVPSFPLAFSYPPNMFCLFLLWSGIMERAPAKPALVCPKL